MSETRASGSAGHSHADEPTSNKRGANRMTQRQLTGRVMFKCPRCKARWARDYEVITVSYNRRDYWGKPIASTRLEMPASNKEVNGNCPHCNYGGIITTYVTGTNNPEHKCDARCTNAKGYDCECSCGGKNHGAAYLA